MNEIEKNEIVIAKLCASFVDWFDWLLVLQDILTMFEIDKILLINKQNSIVKTPVEQHIIYLAPKNLYKNIPKTKAKNITNFAEVL